MNEHINANLKRALEAVAALPEAQQQALADEILTRVKEMSDSRLTVEQQSELDKRLSEHARYADPKSVQDFFGRFGVPR